MSIQFFLVSYFAILVGPHSRMSCFKCRKNSLLSLSYLTCHTSHNFRLATNSHRNKYNVEKITILLHNLADSYFYKNSFKMHLYFTFYTMQHSFNYYFFHFYTVKQNSLSTTLLNNQMWTLLLPYPFYSPLFLLRKQGHIHPHILYWGLSFPKLCF